MPTPRDSNTNQVQQLRKISIVRVKIGFVGNGAEVREHLENGGYKEGNRHQIRLTLKHIRSSIEKWYEQLVKS